MSDDNEHRALRERMKLWHNSHAAEVPVPWPHISHRIIDLLPEREQDEWQTLECWTYANDGERYSNEWGEGPSYLGLRLLDWVALSDMAPRIVEICGMQGAIHRWRFNHSDPEQRRRWLEQHEGYSEDPIESLPF